MNQKQIKRLKSEIVSQSAIEVGFSYSVFKNVPIYAITEAIRTMNDLNMNNKTDTEIQNILLSESVKSMNYQDFKKIKDYFFHNKNIKEV